MQIKLSKVKSSCIFFDFNVLFIESDHFLWVFQAEHLVVHHFWLAPDVEYLEKKVIFDFVQKNQITNNIWFSSLCLFGWF